MRVVGPPSCDRHRGHIVGCLECAQAVAEDDVLPLDQFLARMEHIGWPTPTEEP